MPKLKNKIVFITGASSGIGAACSHAFAAEGADLILCARREDKLNKVKEDIISKYGVKIYSFILDVRNNEAVKKAINDLPAEWKSIDVLVNNAGLARGFSKVYEGDINHWEEMIDTNVKGLLYVTRQVLPMMVEKESGHVINIGSVAGHDVYVSGNVYCASKFAVNGLTQAIRYDVLDKNIKVSTVDPGMVYTEFAKVRFSWDEEKADKVYEGLTPLSPEDVADAVVYCATRPQNVNINEIILTPLQQASVTQVIRKKV